jgi:hypothetical protein
VERAANSVPGIVPGVPDAVFRRDGQQRLAEAGHGRKQKQ